MAQDMITIQNAEATISIDGTDYTFVQNISLQTNNPQVNKLLASPQNNSDGLVMRTQLTSAVTLNAVHREIPRDIQQLLRANFNSASRIGYSVLDPTNGKMVSANKAIITSDPENRTIDENDTVFNLALNMEVTPNNFDITWMDVS